MIVEGRKIMKKYFLWIVLVVVLASGAGYYAWAQGEGKGSEQNAEQTSAPPQQQAQPVSVLEINKTPVTWTQTLPGRVSAMRQSQVRPQVAGIVTQRLFEEGALVQKGQQLYQIDDARYKAALKRAQADLTSAKANIGSIEARAERYAELVKIEAVSRQEYEDVKAQLDQARAAVAVAEAAVDLARVDVDYTKVYAPISGRIGRSLVTEGALVTANQGDPMAVITQLDPVYVDLQKSGVEAMTLRLRMNGKDEIPVSLSVGEDGSVVYPREGSLKFSEVTIDETTGSTTLRAVVPNPEEILLPGLFVRATLDLGQQEVLLVPQRATSRAPDGGLTVWVVGADGQSASPRKIEVGRTHDGKWEVKSGLSEGDRVVIEGYQKLQPGAVVTPSPWTDSSSQTAQTQNSTHYLAQE